METEEIILSGNKAKIIKTVTIEEDYDLDDLIAQKEKELADHIEAKKAYDLASDEVRKTIIKQIRKLKRQDELKN